MREEPDPIHLWVGLGNPGAEHKDDRHNAGALALAAVAEHHGFPQARKRFSSLFTEGSLAGERILSILPQTYMNLSGNAVVAAVRFRKLEARRVLVFHDDIDLEAGKIRIKRGGSDAGHNGLRSITAAIGPDYRRLRIGVGRGTDKPARDRVLSSFSAAERDGWFADFLQTLSAQAPLLVQDTEAADNQLLNAVHRAAEGTQA